MMRAQPVSCFILSIPCFRSVPSVVRECGVQTGIDVGLYYNWPAAGSQQAIESAQYGLAFVDPASIAVSVVSADALEGDQSDHHFI